MIFPGKAEQMELKTWRHRTQFDKELLPESVSDSSSVCLNNGRQVLIQSDGSLISALVWHEPGPVLKIWKNRSLTSEHSLPNVSTAPILTTNSTGQINVWLSIDGVVHLCPAPDKAPAPLKPPGSEEPIAGDLLDLCVRPAGGTAFAVTRGSSLVLIVMSSEKCIERIIDENAGRASLTIDAAGRIHLAYEKLQGIEYRVLEGDVFDPGAEYLCTERAAEAFGFWPVVLVDGDSVFLAYLGESCRPPDPAGKSEAWERLGRGGYIACLVSREGGWERHRLADTRQIVNRLRPIDGAYGGGDNDTLRVRMEEFGPPSLTVDHFGVPIVIWPNLDRRWIYSSRYLGQNFSKAEEIRGPLEQLTGPCLVSRTVPEIEPGMPLIMNTRSRAYLDRIAFPPAEIDNCRVIDFLQPDELEAVSGLELKVNKMKKSPENPVILKGSAGDPDDGGVVADITRTDEGWRAEYFYLTVKELGKTDRSWHNDGRAESKDGIHWNKLDPEALERRFSVKDESNDFRYTIRFVEDPDEKTAAFRFKGFLRVQDAGPWGWVAVTSSDGKNWEKVPDTETVLNADDDLRPWIDPDDVPVRRFKANSISRSHPGRTCAQWTSPDGMHWEDERETLDFDNPFGAKPDRGTTGRTIIDPWAGPDDEDEIHGGYVFRDGDRWLVHYMKWTADGHIYTGLAASRDGINFTRVAGGDTVLPLGAPGTWDAGRIALREAPFRMGDVWRQYYTGCGWKHGMGGVGAKTSQFGYSAPNQMGCAEIPVGRWAYLRLEAGYDEGTIMTVPLRLAGRHRLTVNADGLESTEMGRNLSVCLCDRNAELPGYGFDECDALGEDGQDTAVTWRGKGMETADSTIIRIGVRISGHRIKLFGFNLIPAD